jgi:hypothetical protein
LIGKRIPLHDMILGSPALRKGVIAKRYEGAAVVRGTGISESLRVTVSFPILHHVVNVDLELLPPPINFPLLDGEDTLRKTEGFGKDGDASDDCTVNWDVVKKGSFAVTEKLAAHSPLLKPCRPKAKGGFFVHHPKVVVVSAEEIESACI